MKKKPERKDVAYWRREVAKLDKALFQIRLHLEVIAPNNYKNLVVWVIANKALTQVRARA